MKSRVEDAGAAERTGELVLDGCRVPVGKVMEAHAMQG